MLSPREKIQTGLKECWLLVHQVVMDSLRGYPLLSAQMPRRLASFSSGLPLGSERASAGWYKSAAFTQLAQDAGLYAENINGDAFSVEIKQATIDLIRRDLGQIDMVIYSLAAPARQLPDGNVVRSALKTDWRIFQRCHH